MIPVTLVAALAIGRGVARAASSDGPQPAAGTESLGSELLDGLDPSLFGPPKTELQPARPDFQKRILPGLSDNALENTLHTTGAGGPLASVRAKMEAAKALLPQTDELQRAQRLQQQVVADLDALIEQLGKQCQGACQSSGQCNSPSQRTQPTAAKPSGKPGKGTTAARDSTTRLGRGNARSVQFADREAIVKDLWGHLPPHAREQMLQSYSPEFLPKYELEIEKYFRRLAEEADQDSKSGEDAPKKN
jgi:hypothetical protein